MLINPYRYAAAGGVTLLLDETGLGSATAAYSVRQLRAAYSGDCMRVRRSSDSEEADVEFLSGVISINSPINNLSGGSGSTLTAWLGSDVAFVVTWFDQSGNARDATQSTAGSQPQIASSGALIVDAGGNPQILFASDQLEFTATGISGTAYTGYVVMDLISNSGYSIAVFADKFNIYSSLYSGNWGTYHGIDKASGYTALAHTLTINQSRSAADWDLISNNNAPLNGTLGGYATQPGRIGGAGIQYLNGYMQEVVLWANSSAPVATIQSNINSFYSLY